MRNINDPAVSFLDAPTAESAEIVSSVLTRAFPPAIIKRLADHGTRIVVLAKGEAYRDRSRVLRRLAAGVDDWPAPPAGLFVVEERAVYLRSTSPLTIAHEASHALDCALGGGVYLSGIDPRVRRAFSEARAFVTPYAASALDEYFAESVRAWVEANDPRSPWPRATRSRLRAIDPAMAAILESIFANDLTA